MIESDSKPEWDRGENYRYGYFADTYAFFSQGIYQKSGVAMCGFGLGNNSKIFKLHGSLNWLWSKNSASLVFDETEFLSESSKKSINTERIANFRKNYQPLLITPTQNKTPSYLSIEPIKQQWVEAAQLLSKASKVCIIGYSSPATDISTNLMLQSALNRDDCEVVVCFKKSGEEDKTEERYKNHILPGKSNLKFHREGFGKKFVEEFF